MLNDIYNILLPQIILGVFIFIQLFLAIFATPRLYKLARILSCTGIFLSIILQTLVQTEPQYFGFRNALMSDNYTQLFHFGILFCGLFTALLSKHLTEKQKQNSFTIHAILLTAILGAINIVSANDFITLFVSLELLSFPTYFLIASNKGYYSKEASFKYLITSAVSSGIFLFGVSYIYGITSSFNFSEIYEFSISNKTSLLYIFSGTMIILGLLAKLAIFPFANWIIDVYKGTESSILAFLSTIPKLALFGILCRLIVFPLNGSFELTLIITVLTLVTALWANTYALKEKHIKAIMACSSAANASYLLFAGCLVSVYNLSTVIFYLICYVIMNITAFAFIGILENNNIELKIENLKGIYYKNKPTTIAFIISIIGLAGFPITSGFIAKIYLFSAIAHSGLIFIPFLIFLLILTVIALYYYLKLITPLLETNIDSPVLKVETSQKIILLTLTLITIIIGIYPEKLIELCRYIAYNI